MSQDMVLASSKLTAQGQISVPSEVRRKLGLAPGSVLEWEEEGDHIIVRRAGKYTSVDVHAALFPAKAPKAQPLSKLKNGVREAVRKRHARR
jgi:AbrB family looped-hinge helix DNA binding protein